MVFEFPQVLLLWTAFFFLIVGLPALFAPGKFVKVLQGAVKNTEMMRTRGVISLLFGLAYVTVYQAVDASWGLLFSLMGYASLLKGTVLLWYPQRGQTKYKMLYNSKAKAIIIGVAIVGVSAVLARIALAKI